MKQLDSKSEFTEKASGLISKAIRMAELIIAVLLIVIIFLGVAYLVLKLVRASYVGLFLDQHEIISLLDITLVLFIIVELFRMTVAYLKGEQVLATVAEAAFVAIGRKIVLYDFKVEGLFGALALGFLLAVLILAHYLFVDRAGKSLKA